MPVTLRDIAQRLNLSHATVSFVLNDRRDVAIPEVTRQRVMETAKEMGYRPNRAARALVSGKTQMVAIWVPALDNPDYADYFHRLQRGLRSLGYGTIFVETAVDNKLSPYDWPVDGVIAVDAGDALRALAMPEIPTVSLGTSVDERQDSVRIDVYPGTVAAVMGLVDTGAREIAYLGLGEKDSDGRGRQDAYTMVVESAGLLPRYLSVERFEASHVKDVSDAAFDSAAKPDAILCRNDILAAWAFRALADRGLRVPEEVTLISVGGGSLLEFLPVPLGNVRQPVPDACGVAIELLMDRLRTPSTPHRNLVMPSSYEPARGPLVRDMLRSTAQLGSSPSES